MRNLTATICLTIAVLLGSAGVSASAEFSTRTLKGISFSVEKVQEYLVKKNCTSFTQLQR